MKTQEQLDQIVDENMERVLTARYGENYGEDERQLVGIVCGRNYSDFARKNASLTKLTKLIDEYANR